MKGIENKIWEQMYDEVSDCYNSIYVLNDFCNKKIYSEDICYIIPILKFVLVKIDDVYAKMLE